MYRYSVIPICIDKASRARRHIAESRKSARELTKVKFTMAHVLLFVQKGKAFLFHPTRDCRCVLCKQRASRSVVHAYRAVSVWKFLPCWHFKKTFLKHFAVKAASRGPPTYRSIITRVVFFIISQLLRSYTRLLLSQKWNSSNCAYIGIRICIIYVEVQLKRAEMGKGCKGKEERGENGAVNFTRKQSFLVEARAGNVVQVMNRNFCGLFVSYLRCSLNCLKLHLCPKVSGILLRELHRV